MKTAMSCMFLLKRIRTSAMAPFGRAALKASLRNRSVVVVGIGVPSLVMRRVLLLVEGAVGVVVVGLEGLEDFLPATLAQEYWGEAGGAGGGGGRPGSPGGARWGRRVLPWVVAVGWEGRVLPPS